MIGDRSLIGIISGHQDTAVDTLCGGRRNSLLLKKSQRRMNARNQHGCSYTDIFFAFRGISPLNIVIIYNYNV